MADTVIGDSVHGAVAGTADMVVGGKRANGEIARIRWLVLDRAMVLATGWPVILG